MTGDTPPRSTWWRAHELRINIVLMLASLFMLSVGLVLNIGLIAGPSLLLLIFFATYTVYAYYRRFL
jgi:hypothetical protein